MELVLVRRDTELSGIPCNWFKTSLAVMMSLVDLRFSSSFFLSSPNTEDTLIVSLSVEHVRVVPRKIHRSVLSRLHMVSLQPALYSPRAQKLFNIVLAI